MAPASQLQRFTSPPPASPEGPTPLKFLDRLRLALQQNSTDPLLVDRFTDLVKQFILFHGKRHTRELGQADIAAFLRHLSVE